MNTLLKQLWLAIRIWLLAVAVNTILGTIYLACIKFMDVESLVCFGLYYGAIFSFPIMLAILIIINRCSAADKSGFLLFRVVFITCNVLTVIVFIAFWMMMGLHGATMFLVLQCIAVLSGVTGIITFCRSIVEWGRAYKIAQKYSHESSIWPKHK